MTKKKTETVESVSVEVIKETDFSISVPDIPKIFYIEDKKTKELKPYSLTEVANLEKEIDKQIKSIKSFDDKKGYEVLKELEQQAVKLRTNLDNKRKELIKPWDSFKADLKRATDEIGSEAQRVQDKATAKLKEKADHEAELARLEEERKRKVLVSRIEKLTSLGGSYSFTGVITFDHDPGTVFNEEQLLEMDDSTWESSLASAEASYKEHTDNLQKEKEKTEQKEKELEEEREKLLLKQLKLRAKEVELNGGEINGDRYTFPNGCSCDVSDLKTMDDEEWEKEMERLTAPKNTPEEEELKEDESFRDVEEDFDPLASVIGDLVGQHEEHQDKVDNVFRIELVFSNDNPYFDVAVGKSWLRVYPDDFDEVATQLQDSKAIAIGRHGGLNFMAHKRNK